MADYKDELTKLFDDSTEALEFAQENMRGFAKGKVSTDVCGKSATSVNVVLSGIRNKRQLLRDMNVRVKQAGVAKKVAK